MAEEKLNSRDQEDDQEIVIEVEGEDEEQEGAASEGSSQDEELEQVSARVQKRISDLTRKFRSEQRTAEEAQRLAERLMAEKSALEQRLKTTENGQLTAREQQLKSLQAQWERELKDAIEAGDSSRQSKAMTTLTQIASQTQTTLARIAQQKNRPQPPRAQVTAQHPAPQQQRKPDPKAASWAEKNSWFGEDQVMTATAFGVHGQLIEEGFDGNSEEYYTELDKRLRREMPHRFREASSGSRSAPPVAPGGSSASRGMGTPTKGRRTVRLTASQKEMARRLGVPIEEYAKYVKD